MLAAVAVLLVNDHVLKARWPGVVTGKLSDVAGLVLFPVLLVTLVQLGSGGRRGATRGALGVACAATAAGFALVQLVPVATAAYEAAAGVMLWIVRLPVRLVVGGSLAMRRAAYTADPTDLLALPFAAVPLLIARPGPPRPEAAG